MDAPLRSPSYLSSTLRAISSRLEPTTCLAIASVIDALICFLLTGFPGSKVFTVISLLSLHLLHNDASVQRTEFHGFISSG
jgi:hypothetical protein